MRKRREIDCTAHDDDASCRKRRQACEVCEDNPDSTECNKCLGDTTRSFPMLGSGETKISRVSSLPYTEGDRSQADINTTRAIAQLGDTTRLTAQSQDTTRLTGQLEGIMRLATQPENTTRLTVQTGVLTRISGLEEGKEVTRSDEKQEGKQTLSSKERRSNRQRCVRDPTEGICVDEIKEAGNNTMDANQTGVWLDRGQQRVAL